MALTSPAGRPKEGAVTQPQVTSATPAAILPAGRNPSRTVGDIGGAKGKVKVTEPEEECKNVEGLAKSQDPRLHSKGYVTHIGPRLMSANSIPSAPIIHSLGGPPAFCGAQPGIPGDMQHRLRMQPTQPREFRAFGIDAYPTRATRSEICIDFVRPMRWCPHSTNCHRIHPRDRSVYSRLVWERNSTQLSDLAADPSTPTPVAANTKPQQPRPQSSGSDPKTIPSSTTNSGHHNWNPSTGQWEFHVHRQSWFSDDTSSADSSPQLSVSHIAPIRSCNSSDTEDDAWTRNRSLLYPQPPCEQQEPCRAFLKGHCNRGSACKYYHGIRPKRDESMVKAESADSHIPATSTPLPIRVYEPCHLLRSNTCLLWLQGRCWRGKTCRFHHPDVSNGAFQGGALVNTSRPLPLQANLHPRPPFDETCKHWLRNDCQKGPSCNYVHGDLKYDEAKPRRQLIQVPPRTVPEIFSTLIYKHIKIEVTEGFDIVHVVTGFETSWIYIGNVPRRIHQDQISALLKRHGELVDLRMPENPAGPFVVVKARFVDATTAAAVCSTVDGLEVFGSTLSAKLSISVNNEAHTHLNDTSVRIQWEAPAKSAFVGFNSKESFDSAIEKCRSTALGNHLLKAAIHNGIPAVGRFNLRLESIPVDVETEELKDFLGADGVMWGQMNYASGVKALNGIQKLVKDSEADILEFNVMPPPFKGGMIVAWAHLATSSEAKKLCEHVHARKPLFTGKTRISARHVQSLEYTLPKEVFENSRKDIEALAASAWRMGHLSVTSRVHPSSALIRLGAEDTQGLSKLKAELDVILSGEIVREDGKVVWDRFFTHAAGAAFIADIQRRHAPLTVQIDKCRKHIRLFGASTARLAARMEIMEKMGELRMQSVSTVPLDSRILGAFLNEGLARLEEEVGEDCVQLDLWNRSLMVRGDQHAHDAVWDAVRRTRRTLFTKRLPASIECPVCFDEVSAPITLCCGHTWCKTCIIRYMMTAVDQKAFPLTCLGNDAKCEEKIPLSLGKRLLPPPDFEALIEASFSTYVHRRPDEFSYCPTPDCQQIYRHSPDITLSHTTSKPKESNTSPSSSSTSTTSVGTVLQCPSCLVRICPTCQTEAHDGLACVRPGDGDGLFEEWMKNNDVKPCPGCKMPIEKAMGCHHVTCTICSIHLCWLCLAPFHNGAGVYSHMLAIHGTFV